MSVNIDANSADIDLVTQNAKPAVAIRSSVVICHLTKGFDPSSANGVTGAAFDALGHVKVALGPGDDLSKFQFGFIQLSRVNNIGFFYAGKTSSEGSISIQAHVPPALAKAIWLDSDDAFTPWTKGQPRFEFFAPEVNSKTGDHPAVKAGRELTHSIKGIKNFLFHIVDDREFWSVFSTMDPAGKIRHLAHFHWAVRYDVKFNWRGGNPVVARDQSSFRPIETLKGAPKDADLQGLLGNPVGPQHNTVTRQAIRQAITGGQTSNRSDNPRWFNNVPNDFFR